MNLISALGRIHEQHLREAQSLDTRVKYCILYRGEFPEGDERALMHLVELYCLRYKGRKGIVDEYDHMAHFLASLSHWLFEHFPLVNTVSPLPHLARRQWGLASKLLPLGVQSIFDHAPLFGNARQMSAWKNELLSHLDGAGELKKLFENEPEGEQMTRDLWWLERLTLSALFSLEPRYPLSAKAKYFYSQQPKPSFFDQIALFILTDEPFFDLVRFKYCRPDSLWFPVHLQLVLQDDLIDDVMVIRYAQHLCSNGNHESLLLFDYLLRCKKHGEQIAYLLTAFLAASPQTNQQMLLDRVAALNLPWLYEQLCLSLKK